MAQPASSSGVTVLRAGIEDIEPGHWVVTVFDLLGCFSAGRTEEEAVREAPQRAREYFAWLAQKDGNPAPFDDKVEIAVVERIRALPAADKPLAVVHGFYEEDRSPLRLWDIDMIARLLAWNRQDLMAVVHSAPADFLERPAGDPVWKTPGDLLAHIYGSEQWLLSHLGLALERERLPRGRLERLEAVRRRTLEIVPGLAGDEQIRDVGGEQWSPRKVVRRILWHERDHTRQLETILRGMA